MTTRTQMALFCSALGVFACDGRGRTSVEPSEYESGAPAALANMSKRVAAEEQAAVAPRIEPDAVSLMSVAKSIEAGELRTGDELEVALNRHLVQVDVDGDQQPDPMQVVEQREPYGRGTVLEIRAIPSSKMEIDQAVGLATLEFELDDTASSITFRARLAAEVEAEADIVFEKSYALRVRGNHTPVPMMRWASDMERPVYYGRYALEERGVRASAGSTAPIAPEDVPRRKFIADEEPSEPVFADGLTDDIPEDDFVPAAAEARPEEIDELADDRDIWGRSPIAPIAMRR